MQLLTGGPTLDRKLAKLIETYANLSFAVAWAGVETDSYNALLRNRSKVRRAVIGTHFFQTHADVLEEFLGSESVRFELETDEVFHPKAYLFWDNTGWEILLGSANFTKGGLRYNKELMFHVTSQSSPPDVRNALAKQIDEYWAHAKPVTRTIVDAYRRQWATKRDMLRSLSSTYSANKSGRKKAKTPVEIDVMSKSWDQYLTEVLADRLHGCEARCALLESARQAFAIKKSFAAMDESTRRLLAGIPVKNEDRWGWFGSMKGAGYFKQAVIQNSQHLSEALDRIPNQGPVMRIHYDEYTRKFDRAFPNGGQGVAVASRLLAMKRPDYFVCLDSRNRRKLSDEFGIKQTGMTYDRYWDDVVLRLIDSAWWRTSMPSNEPGRSVWLGRAAMLDAIYYEPKPGEIEATVPKNYTPRKKA